VTGGFTTTPVWLNGAPAGRVEVGGQLAAVSLVVKNGRVTRIYAAANPTEANAPQGTGRTRQVTPPGSGGPSIARPEHALRECSSRKGVVDDFTRRIRPGNGRLLTRCRSVILPMFSATSYQARRAVHRQSHAAPRAASLRRAAAGGAERVAASVAERAAGGGAENALRPCAGS
jgi:hypothetical protein